MMLALARVGFPPSEVEGMPVELAQAIIDLLSAQAQAAAEDAAK